MKQENYKNKDCRQCICYHQMRSGMLCTWNNMEYKSTKACFGFKQKQISEARSLKVAK